jgi:hypothetical protein
VNFREFSKGEVRRILKRRSSQNSTYEYFIDRASANRVSRKLVLLAVTTGW